MSRRHFSLLVLAAGLSITLSSNVLAKDPPAADAKPADSGKPSLEDVMKMSPQDYEKQAAQYVNPGPEHAELAKQVGNWDCTITMIMPDGNQVSTGTATMTTLLGGRLLTQDFKGEMMGMPFEGHGMTGYDNHKKEFYWTWNDTMGTSMAQGTGKMVDGKFVAEGSFLEPMSGKTMKMMHTTEWVDKDTMKFSMSNDMMGKMQPCFTIDYKRVK